MFGDLDGFYLAIWMVFIWRFGRFLFGDLDGLPGTCPYARIENAYGNRNLSVSYRGRCGRDSFPSIQ